MPFRDITDSLPGGTRRARIGVPCAISQAGAPSGSPAPPRPGWPGTAARRRKKGGGAMPTRNASPAGITAPPVRPAPGPDLAAHRPGRPSTL